MDKFPNHPPNSVQIVVLDADGRVLLQKREDFRIWSLPGGKIEPGESAEFAAVREFIEETGYRIRLTRCVGFYWRPQLPGRLLLQVFAGEIHEKVGEPGWESLSVDWFAPESLPRSVPDWTRTVLMDTIIHAAPVRRIQHLPIWKAWLLHLLYTLRALRNRLTGRG